MKNYINIILAQYKSRKSMYLFFMWLLLRVQKLLKIGFEYENCSMDKKIDIVIPTISKDFDILKLLVSSLEQVNHTINNIYIVAPLNTEIEQFCKENNIIFINELDVLGFGKDIIDYKVNNVDRSGWLFQQLLKLSGENFTECEDYLIVDSDTVFVNNNCFIENNKYIFYANEEWHQPYFDSFKKIFGYKAPTNLSLTSHMMIFNHQKLKEMKKELENKHGKKWYEVYISTKMDNEQSCISDYDTYANWMLYNYPNNVKVLAFYNKSISRKQLVTLDVLKDTYSNLKSVSFHSYIDGNKN